MATKVYEVEEVELGNGDIAKLKPLNIKSLRKFMAEFGKLQAVESEEESMDILVTSVGYCLEKQFPELAKDRDELEEVLDMPTIYKIIEVCTGMKLNDPNLVAAAQEVLGRT